MTKVYCFIILIISLYLDGLSQQNLTTKTLTTQNDNTIPTLAPPTLDHFKLFGQGSLNNLGSLSESNGSMAFGTIFSMPSRENNQIYMVFNTRTSSSVDTASFAKSFIFPELSTRDFILGYIYSIDTAETFSHRLFIESSFCKHSFSVDTNNYSFNSTQIIAGYRFSAKYKFNISAGNQSKSKTIGFTLSPYLHFSNISSKYSNEYHLGFNDSLKSLPLTLCSLGGRAQVDFEDFSIFFNGKYILNSSTDKTLSKDIRQFVYTIGIAVAPEIFGF